MSKLQEIIESGIAPGVRCGSPAVNPDSVFAKVPRALKEIERGESRSKRGMDARDISKSFGMTTDFIKKTWKMACIAFTLSCLTANAGEIIGGTTFVDGQTVHASDLNAMVNNAVINPTFISGKPIQTVPTASDYFLFYSPAAGILERETLQNIFASPLLFTLNATYTNVPSNTSNHVFFLVYDPTNAVTARIELSDLSLALTPFVDVSTLEFANYSNGVPTGAVLTAYSPLPDPQNTNNQAQFMIWDTNGVPYSLSLSNLVQSVLPYMGTNGLVKYTYNDSFAPWNNYGYIYPTNSGLTNVWGTYTNIFPITNLFFTNNIYTATNPTPIPTILATDTIPINSGAQSTNTTATMTAIGQWITNQYPSVLPAYTQARVQFSGFPLSLNISNTANVAQGLIQVTTNATLLSSQIYCVSLITNGTQQLWTGYAPNTPYYFIPTATNTMWGHVYTNYLDATYLTNYIPLANAGSGMNQMLYLTNHTSFNADAIQTVSSGSIRTAVYDVCFRTNAVNALYYVTGNGMWGSGGADGYGAIVNICQDNIITTNKVRIKTSTDGGQAQNLGLVQILVNPQ